MKKTSRTKRSLSAESIARLADKGQDVSVCFTNKGEMMPLRDGVGIDLQIEINERRDTVEALHKKE